MSTFTSFLSWAWLQATHIVHIYGKPCGFHKATPHVLFASFHDRISRRWGPRPEELSGWSFQFWHYKHTDTDLAASPSALCLYKFLKQEDCHQPDCPHSCILYPKLAVWDCKKGSLRRPICDFTSNKVPLSSCKAPSQIYGVKALHDPLTIKLRASIPYFKETHIWQYCLATSYIKTHILWQNSVMKV